MISLLFSNESLDAARFVKSLPSQMCHLYTNNINLRNLLRTRHKHEWVLWSTGVHSRKLNTQGREKTFKNIYRQRRYGNSKKTFIWGDCCVDEMLQLMGGLIGGNRAVFAVRPHAVMQI